jgi:chromosome segregation ATPase
VKQLMQGLVVAFAGMALFGFFLGALEVYEMQRNFELTHAYRRIQELEAGQKRAFATMVSQRHQLREMELQREKDSQDNQALTRKNQYLERKVKQLTREVERLKRPIITPPPPPTLLDRVRNFFSPRSR